MQKDEPFVVSGIMIDAHGTASGGTRATHGAPAASRHHALLVEKVYPLSQLEDKIKEIEKSHSVMVGFKENSFDDVSKVLQQAGFRVLNSKQDTDPLYSGFFSAQLNGPSLKPETLAWIEGHPAVAYIAAIHGPKATIPPGESKNDDFEANPGRVESPRPAPTPRP